MSTKFCKVCKIEKEYSEFHKCKHCTGGVRTTCKKCRKIEKIEYNSRDYVIEKNKDFYQKHKSILRERMNKHYWTINGQYHQYKKRAKKSNIEFNLTENDCIPYYNTNCSYCGNKISGLGIDRVNNSKGYLLNNIVPCCGKCNFMKHVMTREEFITQIKQIVKFLNITID